MGCIKIENSGEGSQGKSRQYKKLLFDAKECFG